MKVGRTRVVGNDNRMRSAALSAWGIDGLCWLRVLVQTHDRRGEVLRGGGEDPVDGNGKAVSGHYTEKDKIWGRMNGTAL